jgi:hypothetical protein
LQPAQLQCANGALQTVAIGGRAELTADRIIVCVHLATSFLFRSGLVSVADLTSPTLAELLGHATAPRRVANGIRRPVLETFRATWELMSNRRHIGERLPSDLCASPSNEGVSTREILFCSAKCIEGSTVSRPYAHPEGA